MIARDQLHALIDLLPETKFEETHQALNDLLAGYSLNVSKKIPLFNFSKRDDVQRFNREFPISGDSNGK